MHHEVHPNQVTSWKTQAPENMAGIFGGAMVADDGKEQIRQLREKIGELTMERDDNEFDDPSGNAPDLDPFNVSTLDGSQFANTAVLDPRFPSR